MEIVNHLPGNLSTALQAPVEGMQRAQKNLDEAAQDIAYGHINAQNAVKLITSQVVYNANAKVVQLADERTGTLLDMQG